jgi:hypothetical protein
MELGHGPRRQATAWLRQDGAVKHTATAAHQGFGPDGLVLDSPHPGCADFAIRVGATGPAGPYPTRPSASRRDRQISARTVDSHICRLRTRLTAAGAGPVLITRWGQGWALTTLH